MSPLDIDPIIFSIGPVSVRWYGMMYVIGFIIANVILKKLVDMGFYKIEKEKIDSMITTMLISMFLGARLAYVFIYNWDYYSQHLTELLHVWQGGLSFHGAIVGLLVGGWIFAKKNNISWAQVMDATCLAGPPGLFFGRMGNFINGELYGRITDSPLGIVFKGGGPYPRHPSQIYEGVAEGLIMFLVLWFIKTKVKRYGVISCSFVIGYGFFRYFIEFFREADQQLGYYFGGTTTMGQILCILMIVGGFTTMYFNSKRNDPIV
ncbi:prolipoprotein diacylglyceryl transferase [Halobacteriovorax marinus]|uniref:Phosphatidylglycerol--prolipoprotein diacylglyceryl transferase n=1 Tax=Halobacteriovorax marinus TaxID=97084 RepID=A0A1Y5F5I4_9BACT|nr:prolipoprotein diacylglyceryl transferase [Halobacteriovorax marinus]